MVEASKPTSQESDRLNFQNIYEDVDPATRKTKIIMALAPLRWEAKEVI